MALGRGFGGGGAGADGAPGNTIAQFEFVTSVRPSYQDANGWRYVPLVVDNDDKQEMRNAGGLDAETANLAMLALRAERRRLRDAERERTMKYGTR